MLTFALAATMAQVQTDRLTFLPEKPNGKHVVLLAGDEEYRSEEALPQLARILAQRHGFRCTVLFSLNERGEIDPECQTNQPGLEALETADLVVMALRFRRWPDEQMRHFDAYFKSKKPILALRTSTHAFDHKSGPYERYGWQSKTWPGGFGKQILGETWVSHWGIHGKQATRGIPAGKSPLLNGVKEVFGTTDVYEAHPPADARILLRGEVVAGMSPQDAAAQGRKMTAINVEQDLNQPMMAIAWTREVDGRRVYVTTLGAATDFLNEGVRRLVVNGAYWGLGRRIPDRANVDLVGDYRPSAFGFGGYRRGVKPHTLG